MTSPNYIDYFYGLANEEKAKLLKTQKSLYKGISNALIDKIYRRLYEYSILRPSSVKLQCNLELKSIKKIPDPKRGYELNFKQVEQGRDLSLTSDAVVFGTGYEYYEPEFSICRQVFMMWIDFIPLMAVVMKFLFKMLKSIVMG